MTCSFRPSARWSTWATRTACAKREWHFQVATTADFVAAIEQIVQRKVRAFACATDVAHNTVFENFTFEPQPDPEGNSPTS